MVSPEKLCVLSAVLVPFELCVLPISKAAAGQTAVGQILQARWLCGCTDEGAVRGFERLRSDIWGHRLDAAKKLSRVGRLAR